MQQRVVSDNRFAPGTEFIGYDKTNGILTVIEPDPNNPEIQYVRHYMKDISPLIEANKRTRIIQRERKPSGAAEMVASVPLAMFLDWHKQGIIHDEKYFNKLVNDEYSDFRTVDRKL